ncbi:FAS1-like dehydratase domain-containing protein [Microvirga zambiensis]|uniref:FAS1-like dehydratase domain-containing protein n=1 Tax=Microvirga zambiensis TaxID=1402137 RepID=UPI00191FA659|nr:MaoC family dehydratase N-terminal domain-containing protein [Microvirga zambiensis]
MSTSDAYKAWIGKTEEASDKARPSDRVRFEAIFGSDAAKSSDVLSPLAHWMLFPAIVPQDGIGPDGHPKRGGFLPPFDHLPRRMWTGGRLTFHAPVKVGDDLVRRSTIKSINEKAGGSGELVFVTVAHTVFDEQGAILIEEEQELVYRGMGSGSTPPGAPTADAAVSLTSIPDPVLLFRYSAVTFNGHRIHYDRKYAVEEERYRGLVVHGPLVATMLLRTACQTAGDADPVRFQFRASSPAFDGEPLTFRATRPDGDGVVKCWASNAEDQLVMSAEAAFPLRRG